MTYGIVYRPRAVRELEKLSPDIRRRLAAAITALGAQPRPAGSRKLAGEVGLWRIREGAYRVVYAIDDARRIAIILRAGHRRDVYR